ncbi:MAG TPA: glycosyltransferase [Candidatus Binatia bacterium]|nr:glycosyltransferase [Candidatus Binatia bacterium]
MRIGFFTDTYLPVANGVCYVIEILRKDLEAAGHEVWVFAPKDFRWHLPKEERVIRYNGVSGLFYSDQFNSLFWPPKQLKQVDKLNLDAIVAFTPSLIGGFGAYCSVRLGIPYIIQYGTDLEAYAELYRPTAIGGIAGGMILGPYFTRMSYKDRLSYYRGIFFRKDKDLSYYSYVTRHLLRPMHERSAAVIATSDKIAGKLKRWPAQQNVVTIPTGVDPLPKDNRFQAQFAKKHGLGPKDEIILYAGRLSIEKNLDMLIEAFEHLAAARPNAKLLLVGDFQYRRSLEAEVKKNAHGQRVIFTGQLKRDELGSVYGLATLFAFPSVTDCQALVLNEAALAGLPLVWCDNDSLNPVLIDGKTGQRAKNDAQDFAAVLESLVADPALLKKYGQAAKTEAKKYSEVGQTKRLAEFLQTLV